MMDITERCRAQARSMDLEGWYVTANVLVLAAEEIERLRANIVSAEMTDKNEKVRENRLRRMADRQGLQLIKSRSRDPRAIDYGLYALIDTQAGKAINPTIAGRWACSWSLEDVETAISSRQP